MAPASVQFVSIARILAPHGIHGELKAQILTDFPERFSRLKQVHVGPEHRSFAVHSTRRHQRHLLLKLANVDTIEQAEALRGQLIEVPLGEAVPLAEAEYYWHEVIGLEVHTADGRALGRIDDILRTGSNDVYVVCAGRREILIPAIDDVVKEIDVARGRMVIEPMPGLLE